MSLTHWDAWCWILGVVGIISLTAVLIHRKRYLTLPWFTGLIVYELVQTAALFLIHRSGAREAYFYAYWAGEVLEAFIRFGVMFELARITANHLREEQRSKIRPLVYVTGLTALVCLYVVSTLHGTGDPVVTVAVKISLCTSFLAGFLALCFAIMTMFEGIRLRMYSQAVTFGMVVYFSGKLIAEMALLVHEQDWWVTVQNGLKPVYNLTLFVWAGVFWFEEPRQALNDEMEKWRRYGDVIDKIKDGSGSEALNFRTSLLGDPGVVKLLGAKPIERGSSVEDHSPAIRN